MNTIEIEITNEVAALLNYAGQLDYLSSTLQGSTRYQWINAELRHIKSPSEPSKSTRDLYLTSRQPSPSDRVIGQNELGLRRFDYAYKHPKAA